MSQETSGDCLATCDERKGNALALTAPSFAECLIAWQKQHGRQNLPWQHTRDAYRLWIAEIMLQQTQVATVLPYYERFLAAFPQVAALAAAPLDQVLARWAGLGYYTRARNLHRAAQKVLAEAGGYFPRDFATLCTLPGVGRSTAAAIAAAAAGERRAILDGNVKRVLSRCFAIEGYPGQAAVTRRLWELAEALLPEDEVARYHQASMDLGATICLPKNPRCADCPLTDRCVARRERRVADLPTPRPKKTLPTRAVQMLVCVHQGAVLLKRRPPQGIWGGLWSLPECAAEQSAHEVLHTVLPGALWRAPQALAACKHSFTHFHLLLQPTLCQVTQLSLHAQALGGQWFRPAELGTLGLPAPVARLLRDLV